MTAPPLTECLRERKVSRKPSASQNQIQLRKDTTDGPIPGNLSDCQSQLKTISNAVGTKQQLMQNALVNILNLASFLHFTLSLQ